MRMHHVTVSVFAICLFLAFLTDNASARDRHWGHHGGWHHRHHHDGGDIVAAGIIGLTLGAIIGGALSDPEPRYYRERVYYPPPPPPPRYRYEHSHYRSYGPPEPWTPKWYDYCNARYKSFDDRSGTYIGTDRRLHFCQ
jgi:hypothetical protein